jgi:hypothetical protein
MCKYTLDWIFVSHLLALLVGVLGCEKRSHLSLVKVVVEVLMEMEEPRAICIHIRPGQQVRKVGKKEKCRDGRIGNAFLVRVGFKYLLTSSILTFTCQRESHASSAFPNVRESSRAGGDDGPFLPNMPTVILSVDKINQANAQNRGH